MQFVNTTIPNIKIVAFLTDRTEPPTDKPLPTETSLPPIDTPEPTETPLPTDTSEPTATIDYQPLFPIGSTADWTASTE
jgi:hypothetical protein